MIMQRIAAADAPEPSLSDAVTALQEGFGQMINEIQALAEDGALSAKAARAGLRDLTTEVAALCATVGAQEVNLGQLSRTHQGTLTLLSEVYDAVRSLTRDVAHLGRRIDVHACDAGAHAAGGGDLRIAA